MNPIGTDNIQQLLSEMRALRSRSSLPAVPAPAVAGAPTAQGPSFAERMGEALGAVSATQMNAQQMAREFELGRGDLASTMVAMQKSQVAFRATVEVRNRVVQAYQDIMNMPL